MKKGVILIGGGGHAGVLCDALQLQSASILGYCDVDKTKIDCLYLGNDEALLKKYKPEDILLVNAVGSSDLPTLRKEVFLKFKNKGYSFAQVIHPGSTISKSAKLGEGVQVLAGVVINPGCIIEDNVILNTSSSIDHDSHIKAHTHVAPGVVTSGHVKMGEACHVGTGAKIIQGITLGDLVLVAAGAVVVKDIPSGSRCAGVPARRVPAKRY